MSVVEKERWGRNLDWRAGLHGGITLGIFAYALIVHGHTGSNWGAGGNGSAMGVTLVSMVPLPANALHTQSVLATESKGLSQSKPQEKVEEHDAIPIAQKNARKKPVPQTTATQRKAQPKPVEEA